MDPRESGKLGGRPSRRQREERATREDVVHGRQLTLSFTTRNLVVIGRNVGDVAVGAGPARGVPARGAAPGAKRRRTEGSEEEEEEPEESEGTDADADADADADGEPTCDDEGGRVRDALRSLPVRKSRHSFDASAKVAVLRLLARATR